MSDPTLQPTLIHYLPIVTTILSVIFLGVLLRRYAQRGSGAHLLWWAAGIFFYGLGTGIESVITLWGNSILLNKAWYIAGALLGGYPLAQGTVYLLLRRRTANMLTWMTILFVVVCAVLVILSPVNVETLLPHKPGGNVLAWTWVRALTPIINLYAAAFLIGGALLSMYRYALDPAMRHRAVGNALIALGAILPGFGGGLAKAGIVEALYVGELAGLILIWLGYAACVRPPRPLTENSSAAHSSLASTLPSA